MLADALIAALALPAPAVAHLVIVQRNVNLRADPSTSNPAIRLLQSPEEAALLEHRPEGDASAS